MLSGLNNRECRMNVGKTLFARGMEFVPWKTFGRIIERHKGDAGVRMLGVLKRLFFTSFPEWARAERNSSIWCGLCTGLAL
jgi:hypothetical protein